MTTTRAGLRERVRDVIFEAETQAGKAFDVALLICILGSIAVVMLDSVQAVAARYGRLFWALEWTFTLLFTIEYGLRLWSVGRPLAYARSFFGVVDLLSILPGYLSFVLGGAQTLIVVRALRLLRVFRVLKLVQFSRESRVLMRAIVASRAKITVFLGAVLVLTVIAGALMYLVEGPATGFTSIPRGVYWAIVTLTTVGYGDIHPQSPFGQFLAALLMITGYGIIAVPTGIVTLELAEASRLEIAGRVCPGCGREGHDLDAAHCKHCGTPL